VCSEKYGILYHFVLLCEIIDVKEEEVRRLEKEFVTYKHFLKLASSGTKSPILGIKLCAYNPDPNPFQKRL
jgi:hypothetical protein